MHCAAMHRIDYLYMNTQFIYAFLLKRFHFFSMVFVLSSRNLKKMLNIEIEVYELYNPRFNGLHPKKELDLVCMCESIYILSHLILCIRAVNARNSI